MADFFEPLSDKAKDILEHLRENTKEELRRSRRPIKHIEDILITAKERYEFSCYESLDQVILRYLMETLEDVTRGLLGRALFYLAIYRELNNRTQKEEKNDVQRQFWVANQDSAVQMFAVNWCKVFGSETNNNTYYTKTVSEGQLYEKLESTGSNEEEFRTLSRAMCCFRDKYIAHEDWFHNPIPIMDDAVKIIFAYDEALIEKYNGYLIVAETLMEAYERYRKEIREYLDYTGIKEL